MRRPTKWLSMPKIYRPDLHKSISCFGWMVYLSHCPYSLVGKCWRHAVHQTSTIARAEAPQRCQHANAIVHCVIRPVANVWDLQAEGSERIHETVVGESSASATNSRAVLEIPLTQSRRLIYFIYVQAARSQASDLISLELLVFAEARFVVDPSGLK